VPGHARQPSGHVRLVQRRSGAVYYAKYRLPDGRQVQRRIGPAWSGRALPPDGYYTRRAAEAWLHDVLDQAQRGTLPEQATSGTTVAEAAEEWLRYIEEDRLRKPSTVKGYRWMVNAQILPAFGTRRLVDVTTAEIERWVMSMSGRPSSRRKALVLLRGIFGRARKAFGLAHNPVADVEKPPVRQSGDIEVFSPKEVWALVRAAGDEQDAAIYLMAAFTGMRRGELLALRWRDVDFERSSVRVRASYYAGALTTPKSGKVRTVPLAPNAADALRGLQAQREPLDEDDLVFVGPRGAYVDGSALRRRYKQALDRAGLRRLRFHDLRHTFGTRMIAKADIRRVQEWMGHADVQTTMKYLHYVPREEDARLVAEAFGETEMFRPSSAASDMSLAGGESDRAYADLRMSPALSRAPRGAGTQE
jgi:integrase